MGEMIATLLLVAVVLFLWVSMAYLPIGVAKSRGISEDHLGTVRLLAILGLFIGVTWIVALILACVYPPKAPPKASRSKVNYDPVPAGYGTKSVDEELDQIMAEKGPHGVLEDANSNDTDAPNDKCENCGRAIGRLETPQIWQEHVVCNQCAKTLRNT